jgi:UDP-3-O-acyl-N-acetylglucosamine deacetylase
MPLLGLVRAERSGHLFHAMLMTKLLRDDTAWEVVDMPVAAAAAVGALAHGG